MTERTMGEKEKYFRQIYKIFSDFEVPLILIQGTLLGAIRENSLLTGDDDFDFAVLSTVPYENILQAINYFPEILKWTGWETYSTPEGKTVHWSFCNPGTLQPTFGVKMIFPTRDPKLVCAVSQYISRKPGDEALTLFPKELFDPPIEIKFLGIKILVPNPPEKWLEMNYGIDWRTPVKGYSWMKNKQWRIVRVTECEESPWIQIIRQNCKVREKWLAKENAKRQTPRY